MHYSSKSDRVLFSQIEELISKEMIVKILIGSIMEKRKALFMLFEEDSDLPIYIFMDASNL